MNAHAITAPAECCLRRGQSPNGDDGSWTLGYCLTQFAQLIGIAMVNNSVELGGIYLPVLGEINPVLNHFWQLPEQFTLQRCVRPQYTATGGGDGGELSQRIFLIISQRQYAFTR